MSFKAVVTAMLTSIFKTNFGTNSNAETALVLSLRIPTLYQDCPELFLSLARESASIRSYRY